MKTDQIWIYFLTIWKYIVRFKAVGLNVLFLQETHFKYTMHIILKSKFVHSRNKTLIKMDKKNTKSNRNILLNQ